MRILKLAAAGALGMTTMFGATAVSGEVPHAQAACGWDAVVTLGISCIVVGFDSSGKRPECPPGFVDLGFDPTDSKLMCYDPSAEPIELDGPAPTYTTTCRDGTTIEVSESAGGLDFDAVCAGHQDSVGTRCPDGSVVPVGDQCPEEEPSRLVFPQPPHCPEGTTADYWADQGAMACRCPEGFFWTLVTQCAASGAAADSSDEPPALMLDCPDGTRVAAGEGCPVQPCASGYEYRPDRPRGEQCVQPCPSGYEEWNLQCLPPCPTGKEHLPDGQCGCPAGKDDAGGQCVDPCPSGQSRGWGGQCSDSAPPDQPPTQCPDGSAVPAGQSCPQAPSGSLFHGCALPGLPPAPVLMGVPCLPGLIDTGPM